MKAKLGFRLLTLAALLCVTAAVGYTQAVQFYVTIKGTKQGDFKGEGARGQQGNRIAGYQFSSSLTSPRDAATGMATGRSAPAREAGSGMATGKASTTREAASGMASGKRQHGEIKIVKEWGPASPQLMQAASTNEVLKSVVIEFVRPGMGGSEVYKTLEMTDAIISSVRRLPGAGGKAAMEEVTFVYQKIEFKDKSGKTMAMDDWTR